jgi:hypothetical protein
MTPEPNGGFYAREGVVEFVRRYGYPDRSGRVDRRNFGGIHKVGQTHSVTGLDMQLIGFDPEESKIRSSDGKITLVDGAGNEAASWSFVSLIKHWNRKHNLACYVPSRCDSTGERKYFYGDKVILGVGTDFQLFLAEMNSGGIYYDPGIKVEFISSPHPRSKRRSQFRIKSGLLSKIYKLSEEVSLLQ